MTFEVRNCQELDHLNSPKSEYDTYRLGRFGIKEETVSDQSGGPPVRWPKAGSPNFCSRGSSDAT